MEGISKVERLGLNHTKADNLALSHEQDFFQWIACQPLDKPPVNDNAFWIRADVRSIIGFTLACGMSRNRVVVRKVLAELFGPRRREQ